MKKIYVRNKRIGYKDFLVWLLKIVLHYFAFSLYIAFILVIRMLILRSNFLPFLDWQISWIIYLFTLVPLINGLLHITYYELGSLKSRLAMWIFASIHIVLFPFLLFVL